MKKNYFFIILFFFCTINIFGFKKTDLIGKWEANNITWEISQDTISVGEIDSEIYQYKYELTNNDTIKLVIPNEDEFGEINGCIISKIWNIKIININNDYINLFDIEQNIYLNLKRKEK